MANEKDYLPSTSNDMYYQFDSGSSFTGFVRNGYDASVTDTLSSALRFTSVAVSQGVSVNKAILHYYVGTRLGTSPVKCTIKGFDEDNTADFSSSPGGRPMTTASVSGQYDPSGAGNFWEEDVTSIVNEIFARGGWSSGNALGFWINDNSTSTGTTNTIFDAFGGSEDAVLSIRISAEPDFTPTPGTVTAPTFPAANSYGIKISKPGFDVGTASEDDLYFTTRKKVLKVKQEAEATINAGTISAFAHGLGYAPASLAYIKDPGQNRRFKLTRWFDNVYADPVGGTVRGFVGANTTNLKISSTKTTGAYYYMFIDPLEE
jgi:hypothetical protein